MTNHILKRLKETMTGRGKSARWNFPTPGVYHFQQKNLTEKIRIHLRVDHDLSGVLILNASRLYHLNPTAVYMSYLTLNGLPPEQVSSALASTFKVSHQQAKDDYPPFLEKFQTFLHPDDLCPIHDLDLDVVAPFSIRPSAPYRMDLALTYRCQNRCAHCYNPRTRHIPELNTSEWHSILDQLWGIGIPHIVFTGGEPTLISDLPELISHAENNGQITGINTNGRLLKSRDYLHSLISAGLDHIQITLESHDPEIHDHMVGAAGAWNETIEGLKNTLGSGIFVMTNTTLLQTNSPDLENTLEFLSSLGVPTIGLNALIHSGEGKNVGTGLPETDLPPLLEMARRITEKNHQRLIWYTPTQYCHFDPIQLGLGVKGCTAALYNMCIEPDGGVLPCQSYYQPLGNFLTTPWNEIWNHDLSVKLRERHDLPAECKLCSIKVECGGGCPLARASLMARSRTAVQPPPAF